MKNKYIKKLVRYMQETYKNKLVALAMIGLGVLTMPITDDATILVFMSLIAVPLFFVNKNFIV